MSDEELLTYLIAIFFGILGSMIGMCLQNRRP